MENLEPSAFRYHIHDVNTFKDGRVEGEGSLFEACHL